VPEVAPLRPEEPRLKLRPTRRRGRSLGLSDKADEQLPARAAADIERPAKPRPRSRATVAGSRARGGDHHRLSPRARRRERAAGRRLAIDRGRRPDAYM